MHHAAEDDDLWPVLRSHLTQAEDLHQLDLMVAEHRGLTAAIQAVDTALASGVGVTTTAQELAASSGTISTMRSSRSSPCWSGTCPAMSGAG